MREQIEQAIQRDRRHLLNLQSEDGHFEGQLSSNTFPTCAYGLVQLAIGNYLPSDADDTALSTLALLKSGFDNNHSAVAKGLNWLKKHYNSSGDAEGFFADQSMWRMLRGNSGL